MMKCSNCGSEVPEGSSFCNHCGQPLTGEQECPHCHKMIPATSLFCPKCGKRVKARPVAEQTAAAETPARAQASQQQTRVTPQQPNYWQQEQEEQEVPEKSNFNRNLIIGCCAAAILIALLTMMRNCNSSGNNVSDTITNDSIAAMQQNEADADPQAILATELNRNNFAGDNATVVGAVKIPGKGPENPDRIIGLTCMSSGERPFFKIYQLTRAGSGWNTEQLETRYGNGRTIRMENSALYADSEQVPRYATVNGKDCFYFAYVNNLRDNEREGSNGRVALCLYDLSSKKLTTLNYDGPIRRRDNGKTYIYGKPLESLNSPERRFLQQEAENGIKVLYFPTEEEIKAEQEEKEKEEQEKALEGPENANAKWDHENAEKMDQLKNGEEISVKAQPYEKPIFDKDDISKKTEIGNYLVFNTKKGSVYGFNKDTRKYFVIYNGSHGAASDIEKGSGDSELKIRTAGGTITYDLRHDKAKMEQ